MGRLSNTDIVLCTKTASSAVDSLFEHSRNHFLLAWFQLSAKSIIELGFSDIEFDALHRCTLSFQNCLSEVDQPASDLVFLLLRSSRW